MIKFPFTTLQQFNLDWIMQQLRKILDFMPLNGSAGDVLQRTADGAAWQPIAAISLDVHALNAIGDPVALNDELPIYDNSAQGNYKATVSEIMDCAPVQSVCGYTGDVMLIAADVNALPDNTVIPSDTSDLTNGAGFVDAAGAAAAAPVQSVNGSTGTVVITKSDVGLGSVDNVQQYSASNPPPYPVTSVNGQTGDVVVSGGGGLTKTLLWTNPDISEQFTAQTVVVDLSSYSLVMIEFILYGTLMTTVFANIPTAAGNSIANSTMYGQRFVGRNFTVSTSGVAFDSGFYVSTYDGALITADTYMTPLTVYGIK